MARLEIPDDIQLLLDCLRSRDDLELEEMQPLREWAAQNPEGQLEISRAIASHDLLFEAINDIPIPVPPTAASNLKSFVRRNRDLATPPPSTRPTMAASQKTWFQSSRAQYYFGIASGIAALVLVGTTLLYSLGWFSSLNSQQVAERSVKWFDQAYAEFDNWTPDPAAYRWPVEVKRSAFRSKVMSTEYANETEVFDLLIDNHSPRALLFIFPTSQRYCVTRLDDRPEQLDGFCVGVAKERGLAHVLTVEGSTTEFQRFLNIDHIYVLETKSGERFSVKVSGGELICEKEDRFVLF